MKRQAAIAALRSYTPLTVPAGGASPAAVLVPLRPQHLDPDALEVILTRRATDLVSHAGQVSFPGGRVDAQDAGPEATALREMQEELGVEPAAVTPIGRLDELVTVTGFHIVPIVGLVAPDAPLSPDVREVARVFTVPLERLLDPSGWIQRAYRYGGSTFAVWHFPYDGEDIWGATGRMLRDLVELLWRADPELAPGEIAESRTVRDGGGREQSRNPESSPRVRMDRGYGSDQHDGDWQDGGLDRPHRPDTVPRRMREAHVVVIAGGSGTRFWPLSRRHRPKQLLALGGRETLLAATFERMRGVVPPERWWMVVGSAHAGACRAAVPLVPASQVLVEPQARNTAPAIALAAHHIAARDPDAVLIVLPADHHVADPAGLCRALETAVAVAARGPIVTLGIAPTRPETGYGYIQRGAPDARGEGVFRVQRFCEKPNLETAQRFLAQGGYDWNAGIFVARASTILAEVTRQLPRIGGELARVRAALGGSDYAAVLPQVFAAIEPISFDYGVMEGAADVCVVPVSCGWSDVGSFSALDAVLDRNESGNVVVGRVVEVDAHGCVLHAAPGQVLAAVGVSNLAVVQTPEATLVVPLARAQDVRIVLERLGERGWDEYL